MRQHDKPKEVASSHWEKVRSKPMTQVIGIIKQKHPTVPELIILCQREFGMEEGEVCLHLSEILSWKDSKYFISQKNCRITSH